MFKDRVTPVLAILLTFVLILFSYTKRSNIVQIYDGQLTSQRCSRIHLHNDLSVERRGLNCSLVLADKIKRFRLSANDLDWNDFLFEENLKRSCDGFRLERNYLPVSPVIEEESFPIAYSIVVHREAHQVERMIRAIYRPQNHYCIHVDAKSNKMYDLLKKYTRCFDNIYLVENRTDVIYADYSRLEADLKCMELLMDKKWNYLINLCGMDFPLKTNFQMVNYLRGLYPHQSAESFPLPRGSGKSLRFEYSWLSQDPLNENYTVEHIPQGDWWRSNDKNKMLTYPLGKDAVMFGGSAYNIFSRDFVNFTFSHPVASRILDWSRDSYSPDEFVWATLVRQDFAPGSRPKSSKFDMNEMQSHARLVKWKDYDGVQYPTCHGKWIHNICVYGYGDIGWLMKREHLFANKFDTNDVNSDAAVQCLESTLRRHEKMEACNDFRYLS